MFLGLAHRRSLRLLVVGVLLTAFYVTVPVALPRLLPTAVADQPVSGAFALGNGLGGQIDPRTGQFSVSVPLTTVASQGTSSVTYTLNWDQARAGAGVDRYGLGAGWSLGTTFVDPTGQGTVYPADGGAYAIDDDGIFDSGLQNYPLRDMTFARSTGVLPAKPPAFPDAVPYSFTLTFDDGRVDHFDSDGNLVARVDRFGNRTELTYTQVGDQQWQPTAIIDNFGLKTTFSYGPNSMTVTAPKRSDGIVATTVVAFNDNDEIATVTDPNGGRASFSYTTVSGSSDTTDYLNQVTAPSGASSIVGYTEVDYGSTLSLIVAKTLDVQDVDGNALVPTRTLDLDPPENDADHNYAGYNQYVSATTDALFASADPDYRYTTKISTPLAATLSTYDSAHRLVVREVRATDDAQDDLVTVQRQTMTYPDFAPPQALPGNYSRPLTTTISFSSTSGPNGFTAAADRPRTVSTSNTYDDHGRVKKSVDANGTTTLTTYDPTYGLVTSSVATGKDGTRRAVTNVLSPDKKTIKSTTRVEANAGADLVARNLVSYDYDGAGQLTGRTLDWAQGAAPPANGGGPASSVTGYVTTVDPSTATKTIKATIARGTTAARTTTTVVDLVSGLPVSLTDPAGRVTKRTYDAGGRPRTITPPTGLTTTTSYAAADGDQLATRTVTEADGHQTRTSYDALGRITLITDNVRDSAFVGDVTARTVSRTTYSADGSKVTATDRLGRTSTTTSDSLGRPVREVGPTGVTKDTTYNDVNHTVTTATVPDNGTAPSSVAQATYDALDREVGARTTYPVTGGTRPLFLADPVQQTSFDGIGRPAAVTAANLTTTPNYAGAGGVSTATTVTPTKTNPAPGDPTTSTPTTMLDASATLRTLQSGGQPARAGTKATYDAAAQLKTTTDPLGRTTSYTYAADGRLATRTSPTGTVTRNDYDPKTGQLTTATTTTATGTTSTTTYTYVPSGSLGAGLVKSVTDDSGTITYGYDADRNRTSITYPDGATVTNRYTDNGQLATSTDITGAVTSYVYNNPDNTLKSALQVRGGVTLASVGYLYDGLGRIKTTTRGNGLTTTTSYTPDNLVQAQTTTDKGGKQVEAHTYRYDRNHDLVSRTDTTAAPSRCPVVCTAGATTDGTWTTTYGYDAYQRLISSRVYSGSAATGAPVTSLGYTLDVSGNVTATTRTTRIGGTRPIITTTLTNDTIDAAGQLTQRKTGATTTAQSFTPDGRVLTSLSGSTTSYRPDGLPSSVTTKAGAKTVFSYWADGTRRRATTTSVSGTTSVEYHYSPDGTLVNDTTSLGSGAQGTGTASASYLLTAGREARTLQPNTDATGKITTPAAPVTTGPGVGYLLRDRHTSVTALVDSTGAVTNTYAYSDYGAPALLDGRAGTVAGSAAGAGPGQTNPFQYDGAALRALYTDTGLGTMMTSTRFYDPTTGRFTSRDSANRHNRYVGFDTNPIMKVDPSGQSPAVDMIVDALFAVVFAVSIVATAGAAAIAGATVLAAAEVGAEVAAAVVRTAVAQTVATLANTVGVATQAARLADDISVATDGKHFFDADTRQDLGNVGTLAGGIGGAAGLAAAGWEAGLAELDAVSQAKPSVASPEVASDVEELIGNHEVEDPFEATTSEPASGSTASSAEGPADLSEPDFAALRRISSTDDASIPSDLDDPLDLSPGEKPILRPAPRPFRMSEPPATRLRVPSDAGGGFLPEGWRGFDADEDLFVQNPSNGVSEAQTWEPPMTNEEVPGPKLLSKDPGGRLEASRLGQSGERSGTLNPLDQLGFDLTYAPIEE